MSLLVQIAQLRADAENYARTADRHLALATFMWGRNCEDMAKAHERVAGAAERESVRLKLEACELEERVGRALALCEVVL